jgi:hypothetical protein
MQRRPAQEQDNHCKPGEHAIAEGNSNHQINFSENFSVDRNNLPITSSAGIWNADKYTINQHLEQYVAIMRQRQSLQAPCSRGTLKNMSPNHDKSASSNCFANRQNHPHHCF